MRTVKRKINDETFGQKLADESVIAFEKRRHCDVSIISAEGKEIRAHQVVLAKSPTLAAAMKQSEVRCLPEVKMVFPEFKKRSLIMLLQFLYTGEVDLISASQLLVEFQELCKILKLNPQVRKIKSKDDASSSSSTSSAAVASKSNDSNNSHKKHSCPKCQSAFDKTSKLIFHREQCTTKDLKSGSASSSLARPEPKSSLFSSSSTNKSSIIDSKRKEMREESSSKSKDEPLDSISNEIEANLDGSGFQMPDNFDLPDEIIQEQLPAARYTSTPIHYAKKEEVKRKMEVGSSGKEKSLKQAKGFAEDLAEKRRRIMLKLRGDEIPNSSGAEKKGTKRPLKDSFRKQAKNKAAVLNASKKRKYADTSSGSSSDEATEEDEKWKPSKEESTDEEVTVKPSFSRSSFPSSSSGNKKLAVKVELNGKERIMELFEYRLHLIKDEDNEEDDKEPASSSGGKRLKLAKVGKRIKRIVSEGSSDEEESLAVLLSDEKTSNFGQKSEESQASKEPKVISAKKIEQPATSSLIAKLPRIPKITKDSSNKMKTDDATMKTTNTMSFDNKMAAVKKE